MPELRRWSDDRLDDLHHALNTLDGRVDIIENKVNLNSHTLTQSQTVHFQDRMFYLMLATILVNLALVVVTVLFR